MGCWNDTCFVTNLPVFYGDRVEVITLLQNKYDAENSSYCYPEELWVPYKFTFDADYNDYGSVEECRGVALPLLIEAIGENVIEQEKNPDLFRSVEIKKNKFDLKMLLAAEDEMQLMVIYGKPSYIKHVVVHKGVYEELVNNFKMELWSREFPIGKPVNDYRNMACLSDVLALYSKFKEDQNSIENKMVTTLLMSPYAMESPYFPRLARTLWYDGDPKEDPEGYLKAVISRHEKGVGDLFKEDYKVFENAVKMMFFHSFMVWGRKSYSIPSGAGSQNDDTRAQILCADLTIQHANYQEEKWRYENGVDDDDIE